MTFEEWYKDSTNSYDDLPNYMEAFYDIGPKNGHEALKAWLKAAYDAGREHSGAEKGDHL
jgi:hypothetical protein